MKGCSAITPECTMKATHGKRGVLVAMCCSKQSHNEARSNAGACAQRPCLAATPAKRFHIAMPKTVHNNTRIATKESMRTFCSACTMRCRACISFLQHESVIGTYDGIGVPSKSGVGGEASHVYRLHRHRAQGPVQQGQGTSCLVTCQSHINRRRQMAQAMLRSCTQ